MQKREEKHKTLKGPNPFRLTMDDIDSGWQGVSLVAMSFGILIYLLGDAIYPILPELQNHVCIDSNITCFRNNDYLSSRVDFLESVFTSGM